MKMQLQNNWQPLFSSFFLLFWVPPPSEDTNCWGRSRLGICSTVNECQHITSRDSVLDLGTELNFTAGVSYAIKRGHIIDAAEKYLIYEAGHESSKASVLNLYQALICCSYFGKVLNHIAAESGLWRWASTPAAPKLHTCFSYSFAVLNGRVISCELEKREKYEITDVVDN